MADDDRNGLLAMEGNVFTDELALALKVRGYIQGRLIAEC